MVEERVSDPDSPGWLVTSMLEDVGLSLAQAGRHDEAIAAFERALELGWDVVPDGRCEIARVLLQAGRHAEADALWKELRDADPGAVCSLNAGGLAYNEVGRDEEAIEWLHFGWECRSRRHSATAYAMSGKTGLVARSAGDRAGQSPRPVADGRLFGQVGRRK